MDKEVPVSEGQELKVNIDSVGEKGDGIAKIKGFILFVPGTKKGDKLRVKITKVLPKIGFAEKIKEKPKFDDTITDSEDFGSDFDFDVD